MGVAANFQNFLDYGRELGASCISSANGVATVQGGCTLRLLIRFVCVRSSSLAFARPCKLGLSFTCVMRDSILC